MIDINLCRCQVWMKTNLVDGYLWDCCTVEDCSRDDWPVDCARGYWPADDCARENGAVDDCAHGMTELWMIVPETTDLWMTAILCIERRLGRLTRGWPALYKTMLGMTDLETIVPGMTDLWVIWWFSHKWLCYTVTDCAGDGDDLA